MSMNKQNLILIRGLPGSGKSTFAKKKFPNYVKLEADDWFYNDKKEYVFDLNELQNAHNYCQITVEYNLRKGKSVVVSNTFTRFWEMVPYFEMAKKYNVQCKVIEMKTQFHSIHNVPHDRILEMSNRWEIYE